MHVPEAGTPSTGGRPSKYRRQALQVPEAGPPRTGGRPSHLAVGTDLTSCHWLPGNHSQRVIHSTDDFCIDPRTGAPDCRQESQDAAYHLEDCVESRVCFEKMVLLFEGRPTRLLRASWSSRVTSADMRQQGAAPGSGGRDSRRGVRGSFPCCSGGPWA